MQEYVILTVSKHRPCECCGRKMRAVNYVYPATYNNEELAVDAAKKIQTDGDTTEQVHVLTWTPRSGLKIAERVVYTGYPSLTDFDNEQRFEKLAEDMAAAWAKDASIPY